MAEVGIGIRVNDPHTLSITTYFCHSFSTGSNPPQVLYFRHSSPHDNIPIRNDVYHRNDDLPAASSIRRSLRTNSRAASFDRLFLRNIGHTATVANHSKHAELFIPTIIFVHELQHKSKNLSIANDRIILHTLPTLIRSKRNQLTVIISGPRFISI